MEWLYWAIPITAVVTLVCVYGVACWGWRNQRDGLYELEDEDE